MGLFRGLTRRIVWRVTEPFSGPLPYDLSFYFRTTLSSVHIVSGEDLFSTHLFSLFIEDGILTMNVSSISYVLLPTPVNSGEWYRMEMSKTTKVSSLIFSNYSNPLSPQDLLVSLHYNGRRLSSRLLPRSTSFDVFSTRMGKMSPFSSFTGCFAHVRIDGEERILHDNSRSINVTKGEDYCSHSMFSLSKEVLELNGEVHSLQTAPECPNVLPLRVTLECASISGLPSRVSVLVPSFPLSALLAPLPTLSDTHTNRRLQ